jgi:hypothetical protein
MEATASSQPVGFMKQAKIQLGQMLDDLAVFFRGRGKKEIQSSDPAIAVINQIEDVEVRTLVKELHFLTPRTLKKMRDACTKCFMVPDDCPYVDYSIPDINKAIKRMKTGAAATASPQMIINELAKVNSELAQHLRVNFGLVE